MSSRQARDEAASRWLCALHEGGHAVCAELLGLRTAYVVLGRSPRTSHSRCRSDLERAVMCWSGAVAEALDSHGPQSPSSWLAQPDHDTLMTLPEAVREEGLRRAQALLLGDGEVEASVRAVACYLLRYKVCAGVTVRSMLKDPSPWPQEPPRPPGGAPPGYVRRTIR